MKKKQLQAFWNQIYGLFEFFRFYSYTGNLGYIGDRKVEKLFNYQKGNITHSFLDPIRHGEKISDFREDNINSAAIRLEEEGKINKKYDVFARFQVFNNYYIQTNWNYFENVNKTTINKNGWNFF